MELLWADTTVLYFSFLMGVALTLQVVHQLKLILDKGSENVYYYYYYIVII